VLTCLAPPDLRALSGGSRTWEILVLRHSLLIPARSTFFYSGLECRRLGQSSSEALLVMGLSGFDLTFAIPSKKFTGLAVDIARTAERLSTSAS
jgi:hypothetical protein